MKSPYAYVEFDCDICISCDACMPACMCNIIIYNWDFTCLFVDKDACMGCYCNAPCRDVCPTDALILKYEKPKAASTGSK